MAVSPLEEVVSGIPRKTRCDHSWGPLPNLQNAENMKWISRKQGMYPARRRGRLLSDIDDPCWPHMSEAVPEHASHIVWQRSGVPSIGGGCLLAKHAEC